MANSELFKNVYNPDVLTCLANLSSDEVFTSPCVVNNMLDLLPKELFSNPNSTFLDPACKTGVFLREIAKRLIEGLKPVIPDLQERIDHIFQKQLYGIAITELTALLSRRSLYCSKDPKGKYSVSRFENETGNITFSKMEHTWVKGKCSLCGISQSQYDRSPDLESHAYEFIHTLTPEEIFNMKFDVIIGNPPYQLSDGGAQASAIPIYNKFVEQAKKLNPNYICMIIPSRWMTGGKGLDNFRNTMIHDRSIKVLHDFVDSSDCFTGVEIKGGVCYFLRDSSYNGVCHIVRHVSNEEFVSDRFLVEDGDEIFVREGRLLSIKDKVAKLAEPSFDTIISSRKPYGLCGDVFENFIKYGLPEMSKTPFDECYKVLGLKDLKRTYRYIPKDYPLPKNNISLNKWKIFVARNWGIGSLDDVPSSPVVAGPGDLCTETFVEIGPFESKKEAENALSYFKTKFFRALVAVRKQDQGSSRAVYHYVPLQSFDESWTDEKLYRKYALSQEEIDFIESNVKPMD